MTDNQIKHMVERFLRWRLPDNFNPDGGISFKRAFNEKTPWPMKAEPVGTNLFDAGQAEEMIRYLVEDIPAESSPAVPQAPTKAVEGTYTCPICGVATPHAHSPEQVAEFRTAEITGGRMKIVDGCVLERGTPDLTFEELAGEQLTRIMASMNRLFPRLVVVGLVANFVETAEKIILADRAKLAEAVATENFTNKDDYAHRYWVLRGVVEAVIDPEHLGYHPAVPQAHEPCPHGIYQNDEGQSKCSKCDAPEAQTVPIPDVPYEQHEREMLKVIDERDQAEDALGEVYEAVMGESPEWSNCFGYKDAINEIAEIHRNEKESRLRAEATIAELAQKIGRIVEMPELLGRAMTTASATRCGC